MSKRSDASSQESHDDPDGITVVDSPKGRKNPNISAPSREDLVPASGGSGSPSACSETPVTVKVHKEHPRFRYIGRYHFKHEDKFMTERVYVSAPRKASDVRCPSLKDMLRDVFCGCFC